MGGQSIGHLQIQELDMILTSSENHETVSQANLTRQWTQRAGFIPLLAGLIAAFIFVLTLQTHINGDAGPYTIDDTVGEP